MQGGRLLAICAFALAAGCGAPVGTDYTRMSASLPAMKQGTGRLFFYTPQVTWGGNNQPVVKLDGAVVGFAVPGGFFYQDRPAGRYEATGATADDGRLAVTLGPGEAKYVRVKTPSGFNVNRLEFLLVPEPEGKADMAGLVYSAVVAP